MKKNSQTLIATPFKSIAFLILIWIFFIFLNYLLNSLGYFTGVRITFPMSVVYISEFNLFGVFFALSYLSFGLLCFSKYKTFSTPLLVSAYILLILLGNLSQGSIHNSFLRPFLDTDFQYYHDAIKIEDGTVFLRKFNEIQESLSMHSKTHPPFIVLLHYFFLKISNNSALFMSIGFSAISILAVYPLIKITKTLKFNKEKRNLYVLLFACLPAVNIYSIVSIDGVFLTFSLFFLWGILSTIQLGRLSLINIFLITFGIILANSISFSGTFFWAFFVILAMLEVYRNKNYSLFKIFLISLSFFITTIGLFYFYFSYNHILAFITASNSENPNGFMGFSQPLIYWFTRIENISEILLFCSFSFLSILIKPKFWKDISIKKYSNIVFIGIFTLFLMFITGAYGTGETARACLYIYPYFWLALIL